MKWNLKKRFMFSDGIRAFISEKILPHHSDSEKIKKLHSNAFITPKFPASLRRRLEKFKSLLAGVHANKCAGGVAGVDAAVGKNGDGPAAALEDLGFGGGGEAFGRGGAEREFSFFAEDEQLVLHSHQRAAEVTVLAPLHGTIGKAQANDLLGNTPVGIAIEAINKIAEHDGVVHVVAEMFVGVDLFQSVAGEFEQRAATLIAGGDENFVSNDDGRGGVGAEGGAPILEGNGLAGLSVEDD